MKFFPDERATDLFLDAVSITRVSESNDHGLHPKTYLDEVSEGVCLEVPKLYQLITGPPEVVKPGLLDKGNWKPMLVYDFRSGESEEETAPLGEDNYIWKLLDMIRERLVDPNVGRACVVIAKGYAGGHSECAGDQLPPTDEEGVLVFKFPNRYLIDSLMRGLG
jgi:hypothetical protein